MIIKNYRNYPGDNTSKKIFREGIGVLLNFDFIHSGIKISYISHKIDILVIPDSLVPFPTVYFLNTATDNTIS